MLVKKYMEPVADNWLRPELTLFDAVCTMRRAGGDSAIAVNGMVVLEHGLNLVGILSIKDIIRAVIPSYLEENLRGFVWEGMLEKQVEKAKGITVREVMSTRLIMVGPDDTLMHCADLMIDNYLQRLPVVDDSGRVLGVMHIWNLYKVIADLMCREESGQ